MKYIALPKNKGISTIQWNKKYPCYKVSVYHPARFHLLNNYEGAVDNVVVCFTPWEITHVFLQSVYEKLIFYHGLLSSEGVLHLICNRKSQKLLICLINEVFGDQLQGRVIYSILDNDEKS